MYRYHHRISDRYGRRVASLAVLGDLDPGWRPGPYHEELCPMNLPLNSGANCANMK